MAQHASRQRAHALPLEALVHNLALARERPAVDVENQHLAAQPVPEPRRAGQAVDVALVVGEVGGVDGVQDGAVEGLEDGGHGHVAVRRRCIGVAGGRIAVARRSVAPKRRAGGKDGQHELGGAQTAGQMRRLTVVDEGDHHGHQGNQQDAPPPPLWTHAGQRLVRVVGHAHRVALRRCTR